MRRSLSILLCLVTVFIASGIRTSAQNDREAVLAVVKQLFDAMRTADEAKLRGVFHPSAQLFSSSIKEGKPQITVEPIDAFVAAITRPHTEVYDERTRNEVVHVDDNFASVWAEYGFYRGATFSHCGIDAFQLARGADGWKIVSVGDTRRTQPCEGWPR
jgi:Putative lumazine-binding